MIDFPKQKIVVAGAGRLTLVFCIKSTLFVIAIIHRERSGVHCTGVFYI